MALVVIHALKSMTNLCVCASERMFLKLTNTQKFLLIVRSLASAWYTSLPSGRRQSHSTMMICDICVTYEIGEWSREMGWERGEAEENDKSDVEMKLPFFFHNLNTLSSPAAAMQWHFISYLILLFSSLSHSLSLYHATRAQISLPFFHEKRYLITSDTFLLVACRFFRTFFSFLLLGCVFAFKRVAVCLMTWILFSDNHNELEWNLNFQQTNEWFDRQWCQNFGLK